MSEHEATLQDSPIAAEPQAGFERGDSSPTESGKQDDAKQHRRWTVLPFRSIRGTLLVWQTVLLATALAVFGTMVYQREHGIVMRDVDKKLAERAAVLLPLIDDGGRLSLSLPPGQRRHFERKHGDGYYYALWSPEGALVEASLPGLPASLFETDAAADAPGPVKGGKARHRAEISPLPKPPGDVRQRMFDTPSGASLLIGKQLRPERERLVRLAGELLLAGGGLLLLGLAGGWGLSVLAVRPIERLTRTAAGITADTLSERLDESAAPLELRGLTAILNETFARLEESFARQREFTADASHELRTPLAVVLSQTELALARERTAGEYREALEACHRAAQRMKDLSASLLTLARADAQGLELKLQRFDLAGVVRRAAQWHRDDARLQNIGLELELDDGVVCLGDADLLAQAVGNLISNALRYNVPGGQLTVRLLACGGEAVIRVADTGIGIPAEHQSRVFDRFYRVDPARSRRAGGSGLGLAICKEIVEAHGGRITLASREGHGSTFEIRLSTAADANHQPST